MDNDVAAAIDYVVSIAQNTNNMKKGTDSNLIVRTATDVERQWKNVARELYSTVGFVEDILDFLDGEYSGFDTLLQNRKLRSGIQKWIMQGTAMTRGNW